jgi:hypothetical protein
MGDRMTAVIWCAIAVGVAVFVGPEWAPIPAFVAGYALCGSLLRLQGETGRVVERDEMCGVRVVTVSSRTYGFVTCAWDADSDLIYAHIEASETDARRAHKELAARLSGLIEGAVHDDDG